MNFSDWGDEELVGAWLNAERAEEAAADAFWSGEVAADAAADDDEIPF